MRHVVLATDYDGTLASQGRVDDAAVAALQRFRDAGRTLILVTGRELDELRDIFPQIGLFHRVVAENGGLLYCPETRRERVLGEPPPAEFVRTLLDRGVHPLSVGRSIVATFTPHESTVLAAIRDLGLELQVIFNKGAVMVLPAGVNKATGLTAALDELALSMRNVVAVGDAENDHAMLRAAEVGIAVANALPALKDDADFVSSHSHGAAVVEAMEHILRDDLAGLVPARTRRALRLGRRVDGSPLTHAGRRPTLVLGGAGAGEVAAYLRALLEQWVHEGYQCCILDFGGDLGRLRGALTLGTAKRPPTLDEVTGALRDSPVESVVVELQAQEPHSRDVFAATLYEACGELRRSHGRPHWFIFSNAPAALPASLREAVRDDDTFGLVHAGVDVDPAQLARMHDADGAVVALGSDAIERLSTALAGAGGAPEDQADTAEAAFWSAREAHRVVGFAPATERTG